MFNFLHSTAPSRAPELVAAHNTSSTSLVVKWSHVPKQYYHGKPIGYNVIYGVLDMECEFKFVSVNYTTNTTTLKGLGVYTMYVVNVSAVSSGGVGPVKMVITRTDAEGKNVVRKCKKVFKLCTRSTLFVFRDK